MSFGSSNLEDVFKKQENHPLGAEPPANPGGLEHSEHIEVSGIRHLWLELTFTKPRLLPGDE